MRQTESNRTYFNSHAARWDGYEDGSARPVINAILDRFSLPPDACVLDVGCGTGILTPFLRARGVRELVSTDVSDEMCRVYSEKFPDEKIICADFETAVFPAAHFDAVIIFNAFPHFENPDVAFGNAFRWLKPGGRLLLAHSMNRAALDEHHRRAGKTVEDHVLLADGEFIELYRNAGFEGVTVENSDYFYSEGRRPLE